jgi:uncharacterized protein YbjT (DUF2867 family)
MADKKIIAIIGATGAQGGGLAKAILGDKGSEFAVRAITRDPNKEKAQALKAKGAEVVQANIDDVESLQKAFADAHGVYGVTNFWEHFSGEKERQQAKNIAEAAKAAGVKHVVWSTLEDTRKVMSPDDKRMPMLQEKYRVPHFDAKAAADAYFEGVPTTFLLTTFYWDNLFLFGLAPKKNEQGQYAWAFPMGTKKLAGIAAEDIGKTAYAIFKAGKQYIGKRVGIYGEALTIEEMGQKLAKGVGLPSVHYHAAEADEYRGYGFPGADEMGNMFQYYRDFNKEFFALRNLATAKSLNPQMQTFDQFVAKNKDKIKAATEPAPTA